MAEDFVDVLSTTLCPLMTRAEAGSLLAATVPVGIPPGGSVVSQDEPGRGLFFFVSGKVEIFRRDRGGASVHIGEVDAPALVGEIALVTEGRRSATARAVTHCEFRFLAKELFTRRLETGDLAAHKLMGAIAAILAQRLVRLNDVMIDTSPPPAAAGSAAAPPNDEEIDRLRRKLYTEWSF